MSRTPPPPAAVLAWVRRYGGVDVSPPAPVEAGQRALATALRLPADDREAAWALLAADALLTWAVEDAADAPDPGTTLEALLEAVSGVSESGA